MGRPARSIVRERLAEMLFIVGKITAYDAHKHYIQIFSGATQRNVYYQLRRGVDLGEFKIADVVEEGLILDVHLGEFRVNVSRDEDVPRACQLLLNVLLFGLDQLGAGSDTSSHVL